MSSSTESQTVESCLDSCASQGYTYGGTEFGVQCFCGSSLASGSSQAANQDCTQPCSGNSSEICGDGDRLSLYSLTDEAGSGSSLPSGWTSAGCYYDNSARILRGSLTQQEGMTPEICIGICAAESYTIAATEYGSQCLCDSTFHVQGGAGVVANDGGCDMPCSGAPNSNETCGGDWHANVYVSPNAPSLG